MKRFADFRFPVLGYAVLAAAVMGALFGGWVGIAQVRVGGELGWQGQAVAGEVNPLTITVESGASSVLSMTLRAEQRLGSGWRGQVAQRLQVPVLLAPGGRTRFVFPWPVEAGSDPVTVVLEVDGTELARTTLPLRLTVEKPIAAVGGVIGASSGPVVVLSPDALPEDPLLLSPFSEVQIAPTAFVSAAARDALQAWVAFGGGAVTGLPIPPAVGTLRDADLRQVLREHGPRPPPVGLLIGATVIYLIAIGYALPPLTRRSPPWGVVLVLGVSAALALFYPVMFDAPHNTTTVEYRLSAISIRRFSMDTLGIVSNREGLREVAGWWVERVIPGSQRVGRDVSWIWATDGPRTVVQTDPGKTLILYRYGAEYPGRGSKRVVGAGAQVTGVESGFAPLLAVLDPLLREGDRLFLDASADRRGGAVRHVYRLRWERDG